MKNTISSILNGKYHFTFMKVYHEPITSFNKNETDPDEMIKTDIKLFNQIIMEAGSNQVIIISIVGPYQTGKSSLIKLLTRDDDIKIGDGSNEETNGANLYGPYVYNEIRVRFGLPAIRETILIYFVDTEGICGFKIDDSPTMNRVLLTQILAPYVALSHVTLVMHRTNIENYTAQFITDFFIKVSSFRDESSSFETITISPEQQFIRKSSDGTAIELEKQYQNACIKMSLEIPGKVKGVEVSKYVALPNYMVDDPPLRQPRDFNDKFRFAALDIIKSIEDMRVKYVYDGKAVVEQFQKILENVNHKDFKAQLMQLKREAQFSTVERIYLPSVNRLIESKKKEITGLYPTITLDMSNEERLTTIKVDINPIIKSATDEVEKFDIPQLVKSESVQRFNDYIKESLTNYNKAQWDDYLPSLIERQTKFLISRIESAILSISSRATVSILESDKTKADSAKVNQFINEIERTIFSTIEENANRYKICDFARELVKDSAKQMQAKENEQLTSWAEKVAASNVERKEAEDQKKKDEFLRIFGFFTNGITKIVGAGLKLAFPGVAFLSNWGSDNRNQRPGLNYDSYNDYRGLTYTPTPPSMEGRIIDLADGKLYNSFSAQTPANSHYTGRVFVQDNEVINGRVRVTTLENVGKAPGASTIGWIDLNEV